MGLVPDGMGCAALMPNVTLRRFTAALNRMANNWDDLQESALEASGRRLQRAARGYIGDYQGAVGPFPAWAPLAEFTIQDRISQGFTPDDPLLRTGEMRESIGYTVRGRVVDVGSNDWVAYWQEFGTPTIPARSFIGRALAEHGRDEARRVAERVFRPLMQIR